MYMFETCNSYEKYEKKIQIVAKSRFFVYKTKNLDWWKKVQYEKYKYFKYLQNETRNIKIGLLVK